MSHTQAGLGRAVLRDLWVDIESRNSRFPADMAGLQAAPYVLKVDDDDVSMARKTSEILFKSMEAKAQATLTLQTSSSLDYIVVASMISITYRNQLFGVLRLMGMDPEGYSEIEVEGYVDAPTRIFDRPAAWSSPMSAGAARAYVVIGLVNLVGIVAYNITDAAGASDPQASPAMGPTQKPCVPLVAVGEGLAVDEVGCGQEFVSIEGLLTVTSAGVRTGMDDNQENAVFDPGGGDASLTVAT